MVSLKFILQRVYVGSMLMAFESMFEVGFRQIPHIKTNPKYGEKNTCLACKAKKHQTCHMSKKAQYSLRAQHMLTVAPKPNSRNVFELCRVYCSLVGAFQNMDLTPNLTPTSLQTLLHWVLAATAFWTKKWSHQALEREKNEALSTGNFCDLVFPRNRKPSTLSKKSR